MVEEYQVEEVIEKIAEIKRRLKVIEKKTGREIDLGKILKSLFSEGEIKSGTKKVVNVLNKMLEDGVNEYIDVGETKKGPVKIQHGIRIRFWDEDDKDE